MVDLRELAFRFPTMTLEDLIDLCWFLDIKISFRLIEQNEILQNAWKEKARHEREGY